MTNRFYKVLTEKGLRFIVLNADNPEHVQAAKIELRRRNLAIGSRYQITPRTIDGYEKDR